jgi:hypothetical protein
MPVNQLHPEYELAKMRWQKNRDAMRGQDAVKDRGTIYLPGFADDDADRYDKYRLRALWLGVSSRTRWGLMGSVFRRDVQLTDDLPEQLEYVLDNFDGSGQSLEQFAKMVVSDELTVGRFGILVDYPEVNENITLAEQQARNLRAYATGYDAEAIINWRMDVVSGKNQLVLVVLKEKENDAVDEFDHNLKDQYRVLRLRDGVYTQQLYNEGGTPLNDEYVPTDARGVPFESIPFYFVGAEDNLPTIDEAPLSELVDANIAHYQVSADHMENLHIHGQLTLGVTSSLSAEQWKEANPKGIQVGARKGYFLGENGSFTTATAPESSSLRVALQDLKEDMIAIGARIVQSRTGNQTAEAARIDADSENSVLDTVVGNVSEALTQALQAVARFMIGEELDVSIELNTEFFDAKPDAQVIAQLMGLNQGGYISKSIVIDYLRKNGEIIPNDMTNEQVLDEAKEDGGLNLDDMSDDDAERDN